mmetsp:Transcript_38256/g.46134  ORF Transcript_38256/g.46134 Transcript_38256/m.46134 type:complete len:112 (+) Transcript_38256:2-337(+)
MILSHPGVDFTGGEFYVAKKQPTGEILRRQVAIKGAGDLIVFMGAKSTGWFHGMLPVGPGDCRGDSSGDVRAEDRDRNRDRQEGTDTWGKTTEKVTKCSGVRRAIGLLQPK